MLLILFVLFVSIYTSDLFILSYFYWICIPGVFVPLVRITLWLQSVRTAVIIGTTYHPGPKTKDSLFWYLFCARFVMDSKGGATRDVYEQFLQIGSKPWWAQFKEDIFVRRIFRECKTRPILEIQTIPRLLVAATFPSRPQNTLPVIKQDIDLRMIVITIEKRTWWKYTL